jgi:Domain of unknown function (DUF4082)/Purple acid Phosphatase, N-terminal domain
LADGVSGGNGVYVYSANSAFPTQTYASGNYWVDVAFSAGYDTVPPVISAARASNVSCGSATITWTTDKASDSTVDFGTSTSYGRSVSSSSSVTSHSLVLSGLAPRTVYHYQVVSKSSPVNPATSGDFVFTTPAPTGTAPVISAVRAVGVTNSSAYLTWTTSTSSSSLVKFGTTTAYGSNSVLDSNLVTAHTVQITGLTAGTLYHYQVVSADQCANTAQSIDFTFTTSATATTIWNPSDLPSALSSGDSSAIELGVRFTSDVSGYVVGIRFYKGAANTGTHIGNLWSSTGTLLATGTFTNESATGWQQMNFTAPVAITAGTVYIASYHANVGGYSVDLSYFASSGHDSAPLHALKDGSSGANGLFLYGAGGFPTQSYLSSNYWVDVVLGQ